MDGDRSVARVARSDQAQASAAAGRLELFLFVAGLGAVAFRQDPDLQEMHALGFRMIELAVSDAGAGRHALYVARSNHRTGAEAVFVLERAFEHVRDDLHVAVT